MSKELQDLQSEKRECHYLNNWQTHGISRSSRGKNFGFCKLCGTHINISHGGVSDVRKHLATAKHQQMVQAEGESMDLKKMISQSPVH